MKFLALPWIPPEWQRPHARQPTDANWGVRNNGGKQLRSLNLPESLRGFENRLGHLPRFGYDPEERPLPRVLLERVLRFEVAKLLRRLIFYDRGEEAVEGFFIVWGGETRSEGRVGRNFAAV